MTTAYSGDGITFPDNSVQNTAPRVGMVNRIINGGMEISQRGTSFSSITGTTYTLDRFAVRDATSVTQSTDVPSGQSFKNSLFYDNAGSRTSINIRQPMEDVTRFFNDSEVTLSFWLKSSIATTITVDLCDANPTNVAVTTSWAKYKVTFPSTSNLNPSNTYVAGAGWIDFNLGSDYPDVYLTGVQLEKGSTATDFEYVDYGRQLIQCQRYLPAFVEAAINANLPFVGCGVNGTNQTGIYTFEVATRVPPTGITVSAASHFSSLRPSSGSTAATAVAFAAASRYACQFQVSAASGLVADVPYLLFANSASAVMLFDGCEL